MQRVLSEACQSWTLHNSEPADPETSEWSLVYNAVLAYLRHLLTDYHDALRSGADRDQLHDEITTAAKRQYPWLRLSVDPRTALEPVAKQYGFSERSKTLSKLITEKDHLIRARSELKRQYHADYRERDAAINAQIRELEAKAAALYEKFQIRKGVSQGRLPYDLSIAIEPAYLFGGRPLAGNYTKPLDYKCPRCLKKYGSRY
jgi:hypothetical protein